MTGKKYGNWKKKIFLALGLAAAGMLMSCGQSRETAGQEAEVAELPEEEDQESEAPAGEAESIESAELSEDPADEGKEASDEESPDLRQVFGENCIAEQTFEVELSEYSGSVWFVPYAPEGDGQDFRMQIVQDGQVLNDIAAYVLEALAGESFASLDAVSFFDVDYDNNTDIVLIETYGNTSFAAVYSGFDPDAEDYDRSFIPQKQLSETVSAQAEQLTVSGIREFLARGKKNGEFADFREAYQAVSRLCELENEENMKYNLIYFDEDEIPELVTGVDGYYTSLYTYDDGRVYRLMDRWAYGAMGNSGYEYVPGKNSLRNYNTDYAGAILYTTYMTMNGQHVLDMVAQIETYNFDDVNQNGVPDAEEEDSIGRYSVSYMDGKEISDEECASYDRGEYEYIRPILSAEELLERLNER